MSAIYRYLTHKRRGRRLPAQLVTPFEMSRVTQEELFIFEAAKARDRHYIKALMRLYRVSTARALLAVLPRQRRHPGLARRFVSLYTRALGLLTYDPLRHEMKAIRASSRPAGNGIRGVKLK